MPFQKWPGTLALRDAGWPWGRQVLQSALGEDYTETSLGWNIGIKIPYLVILFSIEFCFIWDAEILQIPGLHLGFLSQRL